MTVPSWFFKVTCAMKVARDRSSDLGGGCALVCGFLERLGLAARVGSIRVLDASAEGSRSEFTRA